MKLKEIIANLDTSVNNEDVNVYWDLEVFVGEFGLSCYNVQQCQDNIRLKSYWVANHICTDTVVGIRVYFLDGQFVCLSTKTSRKGDESLEWLDEVSYRNVKNYIISLQEDDGTIPPHFLDMEEDFGEGYPIQYTGQCLKRNVLWKGKEVAIVKDNPDGYRNFHTITIKEKDTSRQVDIDVREILVPWYTIKSV